jgi:hypothetical protein
LKIKQFFYFFYYNGSMKTKNKESKLKTNIIKRIKQLDKNFNSFKEKVYEKMSENELIEIRNELLKPFKTQSKSELRKEVLKELGEIK